MSKLFSDTTLSECLASVIHWQHYILISHLLLVLVIMRLLFHVDKYDDDKLIGLCVKDQVHQCTFPPLLLCKGPTHPILYSSLLNIYDNSFNLMSHI